MKALTQTQIDKIRAALDAARNGRATLSQLAEAHDLADGACLNGTLGELRAHMRTMIPAPPMRAEAKGIILGIISGVFTHLILHDADRRR